MCGIVGYIGNGNVYDILINGLKRLEYRGYDSAGIALVSESGDLNVYKTVGKVSNLENFCAGKNTDAKLGIAHTRWATHGEPCDNNAHPHFSEDGNLAIVHNGTIENYQLLKDALSEHGCKFYTETDTEVLVQLIEYIKNENKCELIDAVRSALKQVIGAYAIAVVEKNNPNQIIAARKSSPLVVGIGEDEVFLGSDGTPFVEYPKDVVYVKDEEIVIIRRGEPLKLVDFDNKESKVNVDRLQLSISQLEKGGYRNRILNVSPGSIKGTGFSGAGKTDLQLTQGLACDIISHLESKDDLFIPQYEEVFKNVLERYHQDFRAEGRHSYEYKLNSGRVSNG